jgi:hypothetical protein
MLLDFLINMGYKIFYVPPSMIISAVGKRQILKHIARSGNPAREFFKIYKDTDLLRFDRNTLMKSELVLSYFQQDDSQ